MAYTTEHKMLLQAFIQEGPISEDRVKELIINFFNDDRISLIVNQINEQLQPLNMLIKRTQCELSGHLYWVLVSTVLDDITRFQAEFSKPQLALLRSVFSEIITSYAGCLQSTACLNLSSLPDVRLSKAETEEFLGVVADRKWLAYQDGFYYMGVRAIAELMPYFKATYENGLKTCFLCKQVIFLNAKCDHCGHIFHVYCIQNFAKANKSVSCPGCKNPFPKLGPAGSALNKTVSI